MTQDAIVKRDEDEGKVLPVELDELMVREERELLNGPQSARLPAARACPLVFRRPKDNNEEFVTQILKNARRRGRKCLARAPV